MRIDWDGGRALDNVAVPVAEDGELEVKGLRCSKGIGRKRRRRRGVYGGWVFKTGIWEYR